MRLATLFTLLCASLPALAESDYASSFQLDINVLSADGIATLTSAAGGAAGTTSGQNPSIDVGYQFDRNAILLDIGILTVGGAGGGGTDVFFQLAPTYRRYLTPLTIGRVSPFAQGSIGLLLEAPSGAPTSFAFGLAAGAGAEWLFVQNFGLIAKAELEFIHFNSGFNIDALGIDGTVGLTVHL